MRFEIIKKKEAVPALDSKAIRLQNIKYFDAPYNEYEGAQITESVIAKVMKKIPEGLNVYLSLAPYGEDDWLEVNCDGQWLALTFFTFGGPKGEHYYTTYNAAFAGTMEKIMEGDLTDKSLYSPLYSGGQSPVPKVQASTDIAVGLQAVKYFIRTGELYPGMEWLHIF